MAVRRIAVCGCGVAGPAITSILSKRLGSRVKIDIFERTPSGSDQGYGLDLDTFGQQALVEAGVYDQFWTKIARPKSDAWFMSGPKGEKPIVFFRPRFLMNIWPSWFGARPECNRGALRSVLLETAVKRGNVNVFYDCNVDKIDLAKNSGDLKVGAFETELNPADFIESNPNAVNLFEKSGKVLGTYDLVFDSMGWNSSLRKHRVTENSDGVKYSGQISIHGAIMNPEKSAPKELLNLIKDFGTIVLSSEKYIFLQRYGGGENDNRMSYFHFITRKDKNSIYDEIGIKKPSSRSESLMTDADLNKVKQFLHADLKKGDFGVHGHQAIDCLDRVTVRPEVVNSGETELKPSNLPLICLGDSQANCGLGGGGILAMQDSLELAELVVDEDLSIGSFNEKTGEFDMNKFLPVERKMLDRRIEFLTEKREREPGSLVDFRKSWYEITSKFVKEPEGSSILLPVKRVLVTGVFRSIVAVFNTFHKIEMKVYGGIGSDANSKVFPGVKKALDEQKMKILKKATSGDDDDDDK